GAASSPAWHDRVATSPAFQSSRPIRLANESNSCARLSPVSAGWRFWPTSAIPATFLEVGEVEVAAPTLRLEIARADIRLAEGIAPAFEALKGRAEALYVCSDALFVSNRIRISTLALGARMPAIYHERGFVEAGALMSYGPNFPDLFRRAGDYVDKI